MEILSMLSVSQIMAKIMDTLTSTALLVLEIAAQSFLGQIIFRFVDRLLWIIEKTAQWSLPSNEITADENGKTFGNMELVRPLPWILFLPALILLRLFRVGLNIGLFVLGFSKIEPGQMVKFLQKCRKRLRFIKTNAIKNMRQQKVGRVSKDNDSVMNDTKWRSAQLLRSIQMTLSSLSCLDASKLSPSPPPTRIKVHRESTPTAEEKSTTESAIGSTHEELKRKHYEISSEDLSEGSEEETILEKIERLVAANDSVNDEDFDPADLSSLDEDSSFSNESNISVTEVKDIRNEVNCPVSDRLKRLAEVINEEPETSKKNVCEQRTGVDENFANPSTGYTSENFEEQQDYYSPCKVNDDGETAFYSPISSTSASPDRMVPNSEKNQEEWIEDQTIVTGNPPEIVRNGEVSDKEEINNEDANSEPRISVMHESGFTEKTANGCAGGKNGGPTSASTKTAKFHNRGKRGANHASRKKK